eukprot:15474334-Alexandrium_andersonii.AAC.1
MGKHVQHVPKHQAFPDQAISTKELARTLRAYEATAAGRDGWLTSELAWAPECVLKWITALYRQVEAGKAWPSQLRLI